MMKMHAKGFVFKIILAFHYNFIMDSTLLRYIYVYCKTCVHINSRLFSVKNLNLKLKFWCTNDRQRILKYDERARTEQNEKKNINNMCA